MVAGLPKDPVERLLDVLHSPLRSSYHTARRHVTGSIARCSYKRALRDMIGGFSLRDEARSMSN